jgi:hypothetical protein
MQIDHAKFERALRGNLVKTAIAYGDAVGLKLSTLGKYCIGDSRFFDRLASKKPSGFNISTYAAAMRWFDERWPETAARPDLWDPAAPTEEPPRRKK